MNPRAGLICIAAITLAALSADAHAGYQDEKDKRNLDTVERSLSKFRKNPALFNGKGIVRGASLWKVGQHRDTCNNAIVTFNKYFARVSKKGMRSPRGQGLLRRAKALNPWCRALNMATNAHIQAGQAKRASVKAAKAAKEATCLAVYRSASRGVGMSSLYEVLDTWAGSMTPTTAAHITEFKTKLAKLTTACAAHNRKNVVSGCKGQGFLTSSATNRRFDYGDICAPTLDTKKTLTDVAMRLLTHKARRSAKKLPTPENFKSKDGWLRTQEAVSYKTYFTFDKKRKAKLVADAKAAFVAAGVEVPKDLSLLWNGQQAFLDALKVAVDATAGEWTMLNGKCRGYVCGLAKRGVKKYQRRASIKTVRSKPWRINKNRRGIPLNRYKKIMISYKLRGEPYCQVRSLTAREVYKGGGRYQRARGVEWGYVRFQKKCK